MYLPLTGTIKFAVYRAEKLSVTIAGSGEFVPFTVPLGQLKLISGTVVTTAAAPDMELLQVDVVQYSAMAPPAASIVEKLHTGPAAITLPVLSTSSTRQ